MRICLLTTSFPRFEGDPPGNFIYLLVKKLIQQNYQFRIVTLPAKGGYKRIISPALRVRKFNYFFPKSLQKFYSDSNIPKLLRGSFFAKLQFSMLLLFFTFKAIIVSKRCNIIHGQWLPGGLAATIIKKYREKPVLVTIRGSDLNMIPKKGIVRKIARKIFLDADRIITVGDLLRNKIVDMRINPNKVFVIPNGVDMNMFRYRNKAEMRKQLDLPPKQKIILYIGYLLKAKGIEFLLNAMPDIIKENNALLVLIGYGPYEQELRKQVKRLGIEKNILFKGKVSHKEINHYLNASDLFILPSLTEGRPNVILEAMASEIPVIATTVGGIPELIDDGETGFLIPPRNTDAIVERVNMLLRKKGLAQTIGKNAGQALIQKGLTWDACAEKHMKLYEELVMR